jgi:hypothetical protein
MTLNIHVIENHERSCIGVVVNERVYVLKDSSSRYRLKLQHVHLPFCCVRQCCDSGAQPDVAEVVETAKALGATAVVLERSSNFDSIAGLQVEDVSRHVGDVLKPGQLELCFDVRKVGVPLRDVTNVEILQHRIVVVDDK